MFYVRDMLCALTKLRQIHRLTYERNVFCMCIFSAPISTHVLHYWMGCGAQSYNITPRIKNIEGDKNRISYKSRQRNTKIQVKEIWR